MTHILSYANYVPSPNHGGALDAPKFLVVHFTAGSSLASSTQWLCSKPAKASAHVIIGRDGTVNQLVPFNVVAWHAGESTWAGLQGLNRYSIGIELDNQGPLVLGHDGEFRAVPGGKPVPKEDVFTGVHRNGGAFRYWHKYTDQQLSRLEQVCRDVMKLYPSVGEIVGHDNISPGRKVDPGPALNMDALRIALRAARPE